MEKAECLLNKVGRPPLAGNRFPQGPGARKMDEGRTWVRPPDRPRERIYAPSAR